MAPKIAERPNWALCVSSSLAEEGQNLSVVRFLDSSVNFRSHQTQEHAEVQQDSAVNRIQAWGAPGPSRAKLWGSEGDAGSPVA